MVGGVYWTQPEFNVADFKRIARFSAVVCEGGKIGATAPLATGWWEDRRAYLSRDGLLDVMERAVAANYLGLVDYLDAVREWG